LPQRGLDHRQVIVSLYPALHYDYFDPSGPDPSGMREKGLLTQRVEVLYRGHVSCGCPKRPHIQSRIRRVRDAKRGEKEAGRKILDGAT